MNPLPLVSVFLPTYNQLEYVSASLDSVLSQDYPNIEIIVGDDCSTDGTWERIQEYQSRFADKLKAFRNPKNLGVTRNCNEVLKRCQGKYIAYCAGDDLFLPGKISRQVAVMQEDPAIVLSYHDIEAFNSADNATIRYWNHGEFSSKPIAGRSDKVLQAMVEDGTEFMAALSAMVRRDAVPKSGYDERIPVASDWLMWLEVLASGGADGRVVFLPDVLARYRRHSQSVSLSGSPLTPDEYLTLAVFEGKYPRYAAAANKGYAKVRYRFGVRLVKSGQFSAGRAVLLLALRSRWILWRSFYWIAASYAPALLRLR